MINKRNINQHNILDTIHVFLNTRYSDTMSEIQFHYSQVLFNKYKKSFKNQIWSMVIFKMHTSLKDELRYD